MKNALDCFWPLLEFPDPVTDARAQWAWPNGVWDQLLEAGLLCRTVMRHKLAFRPSLSYNLP
jgi:hypothetical protein